MPKRPQDVQGYLKAVQGDTEELKLLIEELEGELAATSAEYSVAAARVSRIEAGTERGSWKGAIRTRERKFDLQLALESSLASASAALAQLTA